MKPLLAIIILGISSGCYRTPRWKPHTKESEREKKKHVYIERIEYLDLGNDTTQETIYYDDGTTEVVYMLSVIEYKTKAPRLDEQ